MLRWKLHSHFGRFEVTPRHPVLARPMSEGGYELISGHRRLAACQVLGLETMSVIVCEMSDDEAVIAMVDANLQKETILPSEKASMQVAEKCLA